MLAPVRYRARSATVTLMWLSRFTMRLPRPLARAWNRFATGAASTSMRATLSSSMSASWLCSAFAIADSSTLRTMRAPFLVVYASVATASPTDRRLTRRAPRRHAWRELRAWRSVAETCIVLLRDRLDLLGRGVALENPGRRELAELVADHVLGDEHRHVLAAVVHGDREADHVRQDHRAPRPGLDRAAVVLVPRRLHLLREVQVHERALLQRT